MIPSRSCVDMIRGYRSFHKASHCLPIALRLGCGLLSTMREIPISTEIAKRWEEEKGTDTPLKHCPVSRVTEIKKRRKKKRKMYWTNQPATIHRSSLPLWAARRRQRDGSSWSSRLFSNFLIPKERTFVPISSFSRKRVPSKRPPVYFRFRYKIEAHA